MSADGATVRARSGLHDDLNSLRELLPYLWPAGLIGLKARVLGALMLMVAAKIVNVYVPFLYKAAVDVLSGESVAVLAVPVGLILAYGLARVLA